MATFTETVSKIPGLTHFYPLDDVNAAKDLVGQVNGTTVGAKFTPSGAVFDGKSYVQIPDSSDFSAATTGELTIVLFLTITNWKGAGASEYVHWMGKGKPNAHEWTFRHYVDGGTGEAPQRQGRVSFYHFNPAGGLGAGSFFQETEATTERMIVATVDRTNVAMWKDGVLKDTDALSGYSIKPQNTGTPVCVGSRGDGTGFLIGKVRNLCFYKRKLTSAEIQTIYAARTLPVNAPAPAPTPTPTPTPTPIPVPGALYLATGSTDLVAKHNALVSDLAKRGLIS